MSKQKLEKWWDQGIRVCQENYSFFHNIVYLFIHRLRSGSRLSLPFTHHFTLRRGFAYQDIIAIEAP